MKIGIGYDIHRLVKGRPLLLGGVKIPHSKGLLGHSDGDALLHAVTDALLGAMGHADIGELFPDTEKRHKGIDSAKILAEAVRRARKAHWRVSNLDAVVLAEEPKLSPYKEAIRRSLAALLGVPVTAVNVKAKTMEGLGPVGLKKAISAHCVLLIVRKK